MNKYEELNQEAYDQGVLVKEVCLRSNSDGLYKNKKIAINKNTLSSISEKVCVLAEELGHHYTSYGNIIDLNNLSNAKQEYDARLYSYNKLVGLSGIIRAYESKCSNRCEIAEFLGVTESFLNDAIDCYRNKYGCSVELDNYTIYFIPNFIVHHKLSKRR